MIQLENKIYIYISFFFFHVESVHESEHPVWIGIKRGQRFSLARIYGSLRFNIRWCARFLRYRYYTKQSTGYGTFRERVGWLLNDLELVFYHFKFYGFFKRFSVLFSIYETPLKLNTFQNIFINDRSCLESVQITQQLVI